MKPRIIIIDETTNWQRIIALADAFRLIALPYWYNGKTGKIEDDQAERGYWKTSNLAPENFSLMLIHGGDSHLKHVVITDMRVWYGGQEGFDYRAEPGEPQIYRRVMGQGEALNKEEAKQLLAYAQQKAEKPRFLSNPTFDPETDELIDLVHNILLAPEVADWPTMDQRYGALFLNRKAVWQVFLQEVEILRQANKPIDATNGAYLGSLKKLTDQIFD